MAADIERELRERASWRAQNEGPFTKQNLIEWRAADELKRLRDALVGLIGENSPFEELLFGDMDGSKSCNFTAPLSALRAARSALAKVEGRET
ncbi:MAG: hypothetical protein EOR13_18020 [Mesorhizobium sp.]|nr:MAG: hypothetical protein EOR13_18020 [Mesorhizobium sp.]